LAAGGGGGHAGSSAARDVKHRVSNPSLQLGGLCSPRAETGHPGEPSDCISNGSGGSAAAGGSSGHHHWAYSSQQQPHVQQHTQPQQHHHLCSPHSGGSSYHAQQVHHTSGAANGASASHHSHSHSHSHSHHPSQHHTHYSKHGGKAAPLTAGSVLQRAAERLRQQQRSMPLLLRSFAAWGALGLLALLVLTSLLPSPDDGGAGQPPRDVLLNLGPYFFNPSIVRHRGVYLSTARTAHMKRIDRTNWWFNEGFICMSTSADFKTASCRKFDPWQG
jgi:hypothetical protein